MLTALRLGNFKAFAEAQRIPIRPLMFVIGTPLSSPCVVAHNLLIVFLQFYFQDYFLGHRLSTINY